MCLLLAVVVLSLSMLLPTDRVAAATCNVPNSISNGQPADATAVMDNFNSIANCLNSAISPTGNPAAGNLPVFSSANTITGGDLSGDCTTAGTLTVTCTKSNGAPLGSFATGTDAGQLTGTISVNRFDNGTNADNAHFLRGDGVWAYPPSGSGGGAMTLIQEVVTSATQSSVTFSSIPATYRDILIVVRGRLTSAGVLLQFVALRFNGDTAGNYQYEEMHSFGSPVSSGFVVSESLTATSAAFGYLPGANATANHAGTAMARIGDYRGVTFFKSFTGESGLTLGTSSFNTGTVKTGGAWRNTAAINSVTVLPTTGAFVDNSVVSLYGCF
jgi:hypothetical protein